MGALCTLCTHALCREALPSWRSCAPAGAQPSLSRSQSIWALTFVPAPLALHIFARISPLLREEMGRDSCGPKTAPRAKTECRIDLRELERERGTETETEREESSWISSRWCHSAPAALALDAGLQQVHDRGGCFSAPTGFCCLPGLPSVTSKGHDHRQDAHKGAGR